MERTRSIGLGLTVAAAAALLAPSARASLSSGALLTNFASATYSLPSGAAVTDTDPGMSIINLPNVPTAWVLVTDNPVLCMKLWKNAIDSTTNAPITGQYPGSAVCFQISFSNCGGYSGFSVTITDVMPANTIRAARPGFPLGAIWVAGGFSPLSFVGWATDLGGPWTNVLSPDGQLSPHYMRWILGKVGMHKTGYIRYCVTIL